ARTYEMVLAAGEVRTVVTQDAGGSYLAITVEPKNASVYIDGKLQVSDGSGDYIIALPYGEHQYRVEAGSYMTEAGVVTIGKEKQTLNIKLQSALATLTVNGTTPGTKIYVNEQLRGTDRWSGNLNEGMYFIEGRLDGHRSQKMSVTLGRQEQKAVTLPALDPMYGMLDVNYKPIGAEVWLDGKQLGTSPDIFKSVLVGSHSLLIKKSGCAEHRETITIAEGEKKVVAGALSTNPYSDFSGKIPAKGTDAYGYYEKAITGDASAQNSLGYEYEKQNDYASAVYWYRKAAEQGDADAQCNLGVCYEYGDGVTESITEAVKWYRKAAEQGYASAQCNLGYCYKQGNGVTKDYAEAVKWFRKAAEQGHARAQYNLGNCYYNGNGVTQDYAEAVKWYRKAAEQDYASAQYNLGYCYEFANGVTKSITEAVKWYRKAAEQGHANAQLNLGNCYYNGDGVTKSITEAVKWYRKAAEQGYARAQFNLGICYEYGNGVTKSITEAVKWYRKAAEQGHARAQLNLGNCYEYGDGVTKSIPEAVKWYRKAAAQGDSHAKEKLKKLGYSE
ncbi:MAG: PEGA domain-containing protein, partial [Muribaculaceae bacterium]